MREMIAMDRQMEENGEKKERCGKGRAGKAYPADEVMQK